VRSGDPDRLEAQAAAFYFAQALRPTFTAPQPRWTNAALDYGYAVLRGAIARGLVAHGLHPSVGLFHDSEQNAFNLADDLIEPFRPLVDLHVIKHHPNEATSELTPRDKTALVGLLNVDVGMPRGVMSACCPPPNKRWRAWSGCWKRGRPASGTAHRHRPLSAPIET
jgi:CRISPR-associated protein Cas1